MAISVNFLQDVLATVFIAYVLFFFAKATLGHRDREILLAVVATVGTAGPICALYILRQLGTAIPLWLSQFDDGIVGVIMRLGIVVSCFTLAVWSPWERRHTTSGFAK
ncbi:hypothetical protein [Paraburkholderia fungorum]|uniref:hypothetical protein n=1 Tax=Paraburkholderia fungorum TaxID=134537 RepID=UPI001612CFE7|nr:hypothetical protein [Paraburkholderia fungorum]MBB5546619.1 hypothetical protein [Paraburkholderia fungorum]